MKEHKDFKDFDSQTSSSGFDQQAYQNLKKKASKVREEIDPEFEEELKKYDFDKMFRQFNERPMRSHPEELKVMEHDMIKKMSRRDIARMTFVRKRREMEKINKSIRLRLRQEQLKLHDVLEHGGMEQKNYDQLVEEINRNYKQLEQIDRPMMIYKSEKEMVAEKIKEQDETISTFKKYFYPIVAFAFVVNAIILIGVYYQNKQIDQQAPIWETRDKMREFERDLKHNPTFISPPQKPAENK